MKYCSINYKIIPSEKAFISVDERGFLFGDGVFETCRFTNQIIYNYSAHLNRLKLGLESIKISFKLVDLEKNITKLIRKNTLENGLVRIYVSRGKGSLGYSPKENIEPLIVIQIKELPEKLEEPVNLWISKFAKISSKALPINYKLAQGLNSTLAKLEAKENNCFDSILLDKKGNICETTSANIFWIKDDILYSPSKNCDILFGTIRQKIIDLSDLEVREVEANLNQLLLADEVFITNVSCGILKINSILPKNQIFKNSKYFDIFNRKITDNFNK